MQRSIAYQPAGYFVIAKRIISVLFGFNYPRLQWFYAYLLVSHVHMFNNQAPDSFVPSTNPWHGNRYISKAKRNESNQVHTVFECHYIIVNVKYFVRLKCAFEIEECWGNDKIMLHSDFVVNASTKTVDIARYLMIATFECHQFSPFH